MDPTMPTRTKRERTFPNLTLTEQTLDSASNNPLLVIQSPKTPTLSRKLKAVSLDSDPPKQVQALELSRDVFSMPNTPKRQVRQKLSCDLDEPAQRSSLAPVFGSNLKKFASNTSISGSQTLKTLPEIMTLQDFGENPKEPVKVRAKGLLERRGSNASLTIDLGSNSSISEKAVPAPVQVPVPLPRLNAAKSVSNLNLSSYSVDRCSCATNTCLVTTVSEPHRAPSSDRRLSACTDCTIYEAVPSRTPACRCRRKSLSNENLYVPPCCRARVSRTSRAARYPRQPTDAAHPLSEDFRLHLQSVQYLQTAGRGLTVCDIRAACEVSRVPKLHQEFWEVPLNLQEKCYVSGSQSRNRYRSVLPNEHSRVHLPGPQSYIHANYIKGPDYTETSYIATQGPMTHTCEDFWDMVWHANSTVIVMLTGLIEKGYTKCELYFPLGKCGDPPGRPSHMVIPAARATDRFTFDTRSGSTLCEREPAASVQNEEDVVRYEKLNEVRFGPYTIRYVNEQVLGECTVREMSLTRAGAGGASRTVHHYWYPNWADHKMANPEQVLCMALSVLDRIDQIRGSLKDNNTRNKVPPLPSKTGGGAPEQGSSRARSPRATGQVRPAFSFDLPGPQQPVPGASSSVVGTERRRSSSSDPSVVPLVVHCSAGIGRTGCFLAVLNGMRQLRSSGVVDVLAIVCSLRLNRGGMVQTAEQYELVHRVLALYAEALPERETPG